MREGHRNTETKNEGARANKTYNKEETPPSTLNSFTLRSIVDPNILKQIGKNDAHEVKVHVFLIIESLL